MRQRAAPGSVGHKERVSRLLGSITNVRKRITVHKTYLYGPRGFRGAQADVEESCAAGFTLTTLAARPTQVDDQRLALKQAHEMRRFLALSDTNLPRQERQTCLCCQDWGVRS